MGTAPRKRLKLKHKQLKQLKRTYKIPRSLKKSIKKNLVKIVKRHKQEHGETRYYYDLFRSEIHEHLDDISDVWKEHTTSNDLKTALEAPLNRIFSTFGFHNARYEGGLWNQKCWARNVLKNNWGSKEVQERARAWLIEQGDNADEVEKLGKEEEEEAEVQDEDEVRGLDTTEEYDWTSTSTLE